MFTLYPVSRYTIKFRMQSIQIDGQVRVGSCVFRQIIVDLASDGILESGALFSFPTRHRSSKLHKIFSLFWGSFQRIVPNGRIYLPLARNLLTRLKVINIKVWTHFIKIVNMFVVSYIATLGEVRDK